jgi:hypothetical protein
MLSAEFDFASYWPNIIFNLREDQINISPEYLGEKNFNA